MSTGPHKDLLQVELRKAELKEVIEAITPILDEIVDRGTWFLREAFARHDSNRENLALPLLCHSQLEMLDALRVMCKEAICVPTNLLVRSIFESHFLSRYISLDEKNFRLRAIAYLYEYHRQYIKFGRKLDAINGES